MEEKLSRPAHVFKDGDIELITRLWQEGETADACCRSIGITRNTWEYHRLKGELKHLKRREKGGYKFGAWKNRKDDPRRKILFGMKKSEIEKRKAEIRSRWSVEEECYRRTGLKVVPNNRQEKYNPGTDQERLCHPRHRHTPRHMNRADQNFRESGLS